MKKIKEFVIREIAGETIMIPTGKTTQEFNGIITLSDTARFIWEHIEEANSLEDLVNMIIGEYEIDVQTARDDAVELIHQLLAYRFLELTTDDKSW